MISRRKKAIIYNEVICLKNLAKPAVIKEILGKYGFSFSKSLGQNFLIDEGVLLDITESAMIDDACVLEVGPGFGTLTQRLCEKAKKVVCVEIDSSAIPILKENLKECDNLKIIHGDIMKTDIAALCKEEFGNERVRVCANLPYYITSPVITKFLESNLPIDSITVMIQKEVAQRICAKPGTKDYGVLTLMAGFRSKAEIVTVVPSSSFMPPPKVESAVIKLSITDKPNVEVDSEKTYFKVIKAAFALRRKTLSNALCSGLGKSKAEISDILKKADIDEKRRGETLTDEEFARISNCL